MEDGVISVARAAGNVRFPASFQLVGTMNLCACGARGDPNVQCTCSAQRLARYRDKPVAPLETVPGLVYIAVNGAASLMLLWFLRTGQISLGASGSVLGGT